MRPKPPSNSSHKDLGESTFFFSVPFVSDRMDYSLTNLFKKMVIRVIISHRCRTLGQLLRPNIFPQKCEVRNCTVPRHLCHRRNVVCLVKCLQCHSRYIGCTTRPLHLRIHEHLHLDKKSAVYQHRNQHRGELPAMEVTILAQGRDRVDLAFKEALRIITDEPDLNNRTEIEHLFLILWSSGQDNILT